MMSLCRIHTAIIRLVIGRPLLPLCLWTIAFSLSGCVGFLHEQKTGQPTIEQHLVGTRTVAAPRLTVTEDHDALGWIVAATEEVDRLSEERRTQEWTGRRYVFSPLSLLAGIVQCPFGLLSLFESAPDHNFVRHGCARLLMLEPLAGTVTLPPTLTTRLQTVRERRPFPHGTVQLLWPSLTLDPVTYALDASGTATPRLAHLLAAARATRTLVPDADASLTLRFRHGRSSVIEQPLLVSRSQLHHAQQQLPQPVDADRWPTPLILQIRTPQEGLPPELRDRLNDHLTGWALRRGYCTIATNSLRTLLIDEQQFQYAGTVADQHQVPLGRMLAPTVVLVPSLSDGPEVRPLVRILTAKDGEVIASMSADTSTGLTANGLNTMLTHLDLLMAQAPRSGCPDPGASPSY